MPISSYHRLPSTSTCKPWNTTKSPRHSGRQRSRTFHAGDTDVSCGIKPDGLTANEGESSGTGKAQPKSASTDVDERAGRRESVGKRTRSTRSASLGRPSLKRRETFPTLRKERNGNGSARSTARNNRSDFSIRSKVSRWKQGSQQSKKSAWSAKRQERSSDYTMKPKGRSNKVHSSSPLLLHSSPTDGVAICGNLQNSNIGQRVVCILNKRICLGVLKYCGRTHFAEGHWCGIVLDKPCGKNDGSVRGVRYFQCKSKYGIFVHSHKVGTLDDYWNWVSSQVYNSESHTVPSSRVLTENQNWNNVDMSCIEKHCRPSIFSKNNNQHKTFHKIEKRTRSHSLDRCCVVKVKLSKQSGSKCMSSAQLVRSASLPKIGRSYSLVSGKSSCDKDGQHHQGNSHNGENSSSKKMFPGDKDCSSTLSPNTPDKGLSPGAKENTLAPSSDSMDFISTKFDHVATRHKKLGHTMSLDTHLRMENGLQTDNSGANGWHPGFTDENSLSNSKNADAFLEGQYASCPSLTPSVQGSKISDGLGTCQDMEQSNREAHAGKNGLEVKNKGNDLESENSKNVLKFRGNSASQSRLLQPSPPLGDVQGEKSHKRLSLPCLLPQNSSNDAEPKKQQQCHPFEGDIDLPLEDDETASSSCGHISDSETSLSSSGNCCLNNSSKVLKGSAVKPPSVKHPSKLQRPGDLKNHVSSKPTNIGRIPPGKKNIPSSGEVINRPPETRPSKLELDKRLQKRNTVSDIRSTVVDQAAERGIPEHVAVTGNKSQEMKGGKMSKLPLLKHGSSPHMQPALKETAPVSRRSSGLQAPSVKTTKPKTSMSSGNTRQGAHEKMAGAASTVKPAARNAQTPRDSAVAATQHGTKTATRRVSASSSKTAKPPASGTKRPSTTSVPEERKLSSSSRPGTKQSSKPISTTQSTSRPNSKLLKFPSRKTPDKSSTPEPCTEHADNKVRPEEQTTIPRRSIHAPDILSQTPEIIKHSVGVQVYDEKGQKLMEELRSRSQHLEESLSNEKKQCQALEASLKDLSSDCLAAAIVVNFFGGELHGCGKNILLLQTKANTLLEELKDTQKRLADEQANGVKLQEEIMYTISEHKIAIEILKANHDRLLGELKQNLTATFAEEMDQVVRSHTSQLEEEKAEHARGIESLMKKHEESTSALVEEHKDEITELENKQSQAVEEIMEEHQVEVETIKADYEEQETKIKNKIEELSGECQSLGQMLKKTQEDAQRDIESRIQDAIKSYESLPAELESMKAVLEIKNEEIKNLRQEKMEIKMELEHLRKIQDRIQKLEQENESLNFVVESKSAFQRQLSVERDNLRNSLEREAKKANRLSLENEELQWRLFNSPSPPLSGDSGQGSVARQHRLSLSFPDVTTLDE